MRDYTKVPGYEHMTGPQARYNYLHDLMEEYQGLTKEGIDRMEGCPRMAKEGCAYCSFSGFLGGDPKVCCNWRAEAQPDRAIAILEDLLGKVQAEEDPDWLHKCLVIASHYGLEHQVGIAQEELAELIQALNKLRRYGPGDAVAQKKVAEEMADVCIMLNQLQLLLGNGGQVAQWVEEKLARQLDRMEKEAAPC